MSTCHACGSARLDVFYVPRVRKWYCAGCECRVAYPHLLQAADARDRAAIEAYKRSKAS